ncbi:MAG: class I SAM-dependent methyltransferase [Candidatus Xenobiia bacterium LiM19]
MNCHRECLDGQHFRHSGECTKHPSSYAMHDASLVFDGLGLKDGDTFLDLGCGSGEYSVKASGMVGESGTVYALDICEETIKGFAGEIALQGIHNIRTVVSDIRDRLPLEDGCIDVCLIATVLHALDMTVVGKKLCGEVIRLLRQGGHLAVIECKKEDTPFGPPMHMRISPEELEEILREHHFERRSCLDLGNNYMISFSAGNTY